MLEMTEFLGQRVRLLTGQRVDILRETEDSTKPSASLDYQMNNLLEAGLQIGDTQSVNSEIDNLIRYCISYALESDE